MPYRKSSPTEVKPSSNSGESSDESKPVMATTDNGKTLDISLLKGKTINELTDIASQYNIEGIRGLRKQDLIQNFEYQYQSRLDSK